MPSFDIVNKTDIQKLDNAVNVVKREISTRYDFHDSKSEVELDKKEMTVKLLTENDMRMKSLEEILIGRVMKQGLDSMCLDFGKERYASGNMVRKDVKIKEGIDKETAKKIVKVAKDTGLKVQASIMDDQVRVTAKKIDDLQKVIAVVNAASLNLPLQFINFRN
jgi:uncharacterized protein YajQ (UPF0234 family)